jgi:pilus assembly protein CpaF
MAPIKARAMLIETRGHDSGIDETELQFQKLKVRIHEKLVDSLDLSMLAQASQEDLEAEVNVVAAELCSEMAPHVTGKERERLGRELIDEVFGLGPLEPLMLDPQISDVLVNNPYEVYVERAGRLERSDVIFADADHLIRIIQRVVSRIGRRIDESSPMVDARLEDGSRINAVIPPLALNGPTLSIRMFGAEPLTLEELIANNSLSADMAEFLTGATRGRLSLLISGGTGAGKTTLLNCMTSYIPDDERLITIEDVAELQLQHKHVVRMETRPANSEGVGEITQRSLVRNSLRMRPDRIVVGEVRGAEALDMLQSMNTGHEGSMTTIHANDTRDALARLELMVAMAGFELPISVVRQYIAAGIALVIHVARLKGGIRRVVRISEITGVSESGFALEDVFGFEQTSVNDRGMAEGDFYVTGYRPKCLGRLRANGIRFHDEMFDRHWSCRGTPGDSV